jgi:DNA-binding IclR family transcriptional regulator
MERDRDGYIIVSICKADDVLKAVADSREPLSIAQIIQALGGEVGKDSVFRVCVTLESLNWLNKIGDHYELGMGLALFWAKKKSLLEASRIRVERDLALLSPTELHKTEDQP